MAKANGDGVEVSLIAVSRRMISAIMRDFLTLTLIFPLLPSSSLLLLQVILLSTFPLHRIGAPNYRAFLNQATLSAVLNVALSAAFLLCFSLIDTPSITRIVLHRFYDRPVRLLSAAVSAISFFLYLKQFPVLLLATAASATLFLYWRWVRVVVIVSTCAWLMSVFLCVAAAHTVPYVYSKAARGKHAKELTRDHVSLPSDDHEVTLVDSVV